MLFSGTFKAATTSKTLPNLLRLSSEEENYGIQAPPSTPDDKKLTKFVELNENTSDLDHTPNISVKDESKSKNSDPIHQSNQSKIEAQTVEEKLNLDQKDEVPTNEDLVLRRSAKAPRSLHAQKRFFL